MSSLLPAETQEERQSHRSGNGGDRQDPHRSPTTGPVLAGQTRYAGGSRQADHGQCEASSEEKLAIKLEKVKIRLEADAPKMRQPGAALIAHFLDPDRLPVGKRWSRKHTYTQRRLCERFAAPVIGTVTCQDIKTRHTQAVVNAAPTASEGNWVHRMVSTMVSVGIDGGYLVNPPAR